ncbi:MAG: TlpA family protein disulfide reductase [Caldilineaceae bacterium]|nr:TlpA family protein disulfide reductase [Caldilineaceae bacterium]
MHEEQPSPAAPARPAWRRLLPVLALVAAAWFGVGWLTRAEHRPARVEGQVPPLQMTAFDGSPIDLGALRGQGVVVNFWASWCAPCRVEAELFEAAWRAERDRGIVFVGVNRQDTTAAAQAFIDEFDVSYPNGADSEGTWGRTFGVAGLPTTFFIDPQGEIQAVVWGPIITAGELTRQLDKIRPAAR